MTEPTTPNDHPPAVYRGRFAPSPTGALHFGSMVAAVASHLDARAHGGRWLVRIEDVDPPREAPGAAAEILATLAACGMRADEPVLYQSTRLDAYVQAIERLHAAGHTYPCACSRKEIADSGVAGLEGPVYPGTCRAGIAPGRVARALRVRCDDAPVGFDDAIQGRVEQRIGREIGDFVLRRADGFVAYQLAVVVDDAAQGITHVVRGADLLASTPRQIWLQRLLGLPTPRYAHVPVALDDEGRKLSKQTLAAPVRAEHPVPLLCAVLRFLGQAPASELQRASLAEFWSWAIAHWSLARVPRVAGLPLSRETPAA